jgi:tetratricopeptide (TPR) repeat protein
MCYSGLGLVYYHRAKYTDAIAATDQAIKLAAAPDPVDFYVLGMAYQQAKRYPDAGFAYSRCAEISGPMQPRCKQNLDLVKKLAADEKPTLLKQKSP